MKVYTRRYIHEGILRNTSKYDEAFVWFFHIFNIQLVYKFANKDI